MHRAHDEPRKTVSIYPLLQMHATDCDGKLGARSKPVHNVKPDPVAEVPATNSTSGGFRGQQRQNQRRGRTIGVRAWLLLAISIWLIVKRYHAPRQLAGPTEGYTGR